MLSQIDSEAVLIDGVCTAKLDPSVIPRERRQEAERIARELEDGLVAVETDEDVAPRANADISGPSPLSQVPLTKEHLSQHDSLSGAPEFASEHRAKRGLLAAHAFVESPMVTEMKRINALNLEPALPKLDDRTRNDWINFKHSQSRNASKPVQPNALKMDFQESLKLIRQRVSRKQRELGLTDEIFASGTEASLQCLDHAEESGPEQAIDAQPATPSKVSFAFNPAAKEFAFNPEASVFTPIQFGSNDIGSAGGTPVAYVLPGRSPMVPDGASIAFVAQPPPVESPSMPEISIMEFVISVTYSPLLGKSLAEILEPFFGLSSSETSHCLRASHSWPEAVGPALQQVLGKPDPTIPMPQVNHSMASTVPSGWQDEQVPMILPSGSPAQTGSAQPPMAYAQPGFALQAGVPGSGQPTQMHPPMLPAGVPSGGQPTQMHPPMYPAPQNAVASQHPHGFDSMSMQGQQVAFNQQGQQIVQQPTMLPTIMPGEVQPPTMLPPDMIGTQTGHGLPASNFGGQVVMPVLAQGGYAQGYVQGPMPPGHGQQPPLGSQPQMDTLQGQMMQQQLYHQE